MSHYVFSRQAENDLIEIYRYGYLNHGQRKAELYQEALKRKCELLADSPYICRERNEFTPPVHIHPHKKHLIIYTIETDHILIIRFCHERMNIPQYLEN
ncbi:MAG: type II toxin-antitoxin system RelE/ParE family toxin [Methylococcales bacterium]